MSDQGTLVDGKHLLSVSGWDFLYRSENLGRAAWSNQPVIGDVEKLRDLCAMAEPQVIVELGSRFGGTALALHDAAPEADLFAFDQDFNADGDDIVNYDGNALDGVLGYDNREYFPKRSWFPENVRFIKANFVADIDLVKKTVGLARGERLFLFVDGGHGEKVRDSALYADWLRPGDVMAVNNAHEHTIEEVEAVIEPHGYERWRFKWCEQVGLMLTRAWIKG